MTCAVDWRLVLEFVKALAPAIGAIGAVAVASALGLRAFREQKNLERRLEWYQAMHRLLGELGNTAGLAALADKRKDQARRDAYLLRLNELGKDLSRLTGDAWLFASQKGFTAIQVMMVQGTPIMANIEALGITEPVADELQQVLGLAAVRLAEDLRVHLGSGAVEALEPEEAARQAEIANDHLKALRK